MAAPAAGRFDEQEDVVLCGPLRKDKSKNERFGILYAMPLMGGGVARLEIYADEKAFNKKKSPKSVLAIKDMEKCEKTEPNSSPNSRGLHRFVINFKNGDQYSYNCVAAEHQHNWYSWLHEFISQEPDVSRFGFHKSFSRVRIVPADLAVKMGMANSVSQPCTLAYSVGEVGVFFAMRHKPRFTVPVRFLRSAGYNGNLMHFQCGRRTTCGEGFMHFEASDEHEAKSMKEALYYEMSRGVSSSSPPAPNPSPGSSSYGSYPLNIPANSTSMAYAITNNARLPQPIPDASGSFTDRSTPRSFTEDPSSPVVNGNGSVRSNSHSHRPRAAAVTASMTRQQSFSRQYSEPPSGSLHRQMSLRASSSSFGSMESDAPFMSTPVRNKKMSTYEDMGLSWQDQHSGDQQDAYEDMQPMMSSHSRTHSTVSASSMDDNNSLLHSRLSAMSLDSQSSRRAIPNGLKGMSVPTAPGLYANRLVREPTDTDTDEHYVNVGPIKAQRSQEPGEAHKHCKVQEDGDVADQYENVWVVVNNPSTKQPTPPAERSLPSQPINISQPGSRRSSRIDLQASSGPRNSGSWHNVAMPVSVPTQSSKTNTRTSYSGSDSGVVFPMDETSPPVHVHAVSQQ